MTHEYVMTLVKGFISKVKVHSGYIAKMCIRVYNL